MSSLPTASMYRHDRGTMRQRSWRVLAGALLGAAISVAAALGVVAGERSEHVRAVPAGPAAGHGSWPFIDSDFAANEPRTAPQRTDPNDEIAAVAARLRELGLRRIVVCRLGGDAGAPSLDAKASQANWTACAAGPSRIVPAAREIAAADPQAVIVDGATADAVVFIRALRASDSFAMVVAASSVDPAVLAHSLSPATRMWLAVAQTVRDPGVGPDRASRVRLALLTGKGAIPN
jgi:hypothetical protein